MNILVGKNSGFCAGVKHTIERAEEELRNDKNVIDCLGEPIHNEQVVENLRQKGLNIINSIEDAHDRVIIRAHGTSRSVYEYAKKHNINIIDLTCPNVLKIHNSVESFSNMGYFVFLFGIKNHPETIGTYSFCNEDSYLLQDMSDIPLAIDKLKSSNLKNVLIISQTTFSIKLFEEMKNCVLSNLEPVYNVHVENSICNATSLRQKETRDIASLVDLMIIIGGKNSSNTQKLYELSKICCNNVLYIQSKDDLDVNYIKNFENVGIMAGASTPQSTIDGVYSFCRNC